jgi:hypothetical protein
MAKEPENLTLHHLRELRELLERRFDMVATDMDAMRAEMRETRSALVGVGHLVHLLSGDMKAAFEAIGARLDRLERERA